MTERERKRGDREREKRRKRERKRERERKEREKREKEGEREEREKREKERKRGRDKIPLFQLISFLTSPLCDSKILKLKVENYHSSLCHFFKIRVLLYAFCS